VKEDFRGAVWRLAIFMTVCALGLVAMLAIFAQLRFTSDVTYSAEFSNVSGLEAGNFVRIAGVEVGKVKKIWVRDDATAVVEFGTDETVVLTDGSKAVIRFRNLIGDRYLALEEGAGGTRRLPRGGTIPLDRTSPALDLDALLSGFRPLFRALDPEQVNALSSELIGALQGEGATLRSFLVHTAALTNTLADRDDLIGQVIANLDIVLGSLGSGTSELATSIDALSSLLATLADRKQDLRNGIAYGNEAAGSVADLLAEARPSLATIVREADRTSANILADREYFDNLLRTLPDAYQKLNRQGLYGDFFSFYLCDLILKLNGKGGQPVYVKLAGQVSGRCAPR
jgi:phospholipid/cholesterol/gamma-HCH transport system substrate-binding protein